MSQPAPDKPSMYCRQCQYVLDGLRENRCPECGTDFDPSKPETFWRTQEGPWRWEPFAALVCSFPGWYVIDIGDQGVLGLTGLLSGIIGVGFGIGLGLSGCRRGGGPSRALSAVALFLNAFMAALIVIRWAW